MRQQGFYKIKWATGMPPNPYWIWTVGYWNGEDWRCMADYDFSYPDNYYQIQEIGEFLFSRDPIKGIDY